MTNNDLKTGQNLKRTDDNDVRKADNGGEIRMMTLVMIIISIIPLYSKDSHVKNSTKQSTHPSVNRPNIQTSVNEAEDRKAC